MSRLIIAHCCSWLVDLIEVINQNIKRQKISNNLELLLLHYKRKPFVKSVVTVVSNIKHVYDIKPYLVNNYFNKII